MFLRREILNVQRARWYVRRSQDINYVDQYNAYNIFADGPAQSPLVLVSGNYYGGSPTKTGMRFEHVTNRGSMTWTGTRFQDFFGGALTGSYWSVGPIGSLEAATRGDFGGPSGNLNDFALFDAAGGNWYVRYNAGTGGAGGTVGTYTWGIAGDVGIGGDFNGDGLADPTVWRPSDGYWFVLMPTCTPYSGLTPTGYPQGGCYKQWGLAQHNPQISSDDIPIEGLLQMQP